VDKDFEKKTGTTPYDAYQATMASGQMGPSVGYLGKEFIIYDDMYEGYRVVSVDQGQVAQLVCIYDRSVFNADGQKTGATVIAWIGKDGKFHPLTDWRDDATGRPEGMHAADYNAPKIKLTSLEQLEKNSNGFAAGGSSEL
jgi:hypothetical protein